MSSPIAKSKKSILDNALQFIHKKSSHNNRVSIISQLLSDKISSLYPDQTIKCLDIGCGDMTISEAIKNKNPKTQWVCIDLYKLPEKYKEDDRWEKYKQFDGQNMPFEDHTFEVGLFTDVLHHVPSEIKLKLMGEALRVCKIILIKDHFEYGWWTRKILQGMDIVGNFGYGVSIPKRYFTKHRYNSLLDDIDADEIEQHIGIDLYGHLPIVSTVVNPKVQFISVIQSKK